MADVSNSVNLTKARAMLEDMVFPCSLSASRSPALFPLSFSRVGSPSTLPFTFTSFSHPLSPFQMRYPAHRAQALIELASVESVLGNLDQAIHYVEDAILGGFSDLKRLSEPAFNNIRAHSAYLALLSLDPSPGNRRRVVEAAVVKDEPKKEGKEEAKKEEANKEEVKKEEPKKEEPKEEPKEVKKEDDKVRN